MRLNSNSNNKAYSTNFDTRALETIEINLGGTADAAAEILLMDKYRMFFVHAYSADGKTIGEIVTKSIYGDNVTPATNNTSTVHTVGRCSNDRNAIYRRNLSLNSTFRERC